MIAQADLNLSLSHDNPRNLTQLYGIYNAVVWPMSKDFDLIFTTKQWITNLYIDSSKMMLPLHCGLRVGAHPLRLITFLSFSPSNYVGLFYYRNWWLKVYSIKLAAATEGNALPLLQWLWGLSGWANSLFCSCAERLWSKEI